MSPKPNSGSQSSSVLDTASPICTGGRAIRGAGEGVHGEIRRIEREWEEGRRQVERERGEREQEVRGEEGMRRDGGWRRK
jgi:hypothetical protein